MSVHLSTPINKLTRVGKVTSGRLSKLGIESAKDLLEHYPTRFEDYSQILRTDQFWEGQTGTIFGFIEKIETKKTPKIKMNLTQAILRDEHGHVRIIWFNQPFISENLKQGEKIAVAGKIEKDWEGWVIKNPSYEKIQSPDDAVHTSGLVPVYPLTYGLTQKQIRFLTHQSLNAAEEFIDLIPENIKKQENLMTKSEAIRNAHHPKDTKSYLEAIRMLKFEEMFINQIMTIEERAKLAKEKSPQIPFNKEAVEKFVKSLKFKLTDDQKKVAWRILQDMQKNTPMNRLLQGEVGSGKTIVAAIAALNALEAEFQTAIMAPTEILALQHFQTILSIFPDKPIALLTNKYAKLNPENEKSTKDQIKKSISNGEIKIIIGTHAILQKDVQFCSLGLVVIDEQHRFGVEQRKSLKDKSPYDVPHLLSMTATPIPRSLALTVFGDLDISTIRQMPVGRKKIQTRVVEEENRNKAYAFIKEKISKGGQVFVICPLIEESDALGVKSATQEYEKLKSKIFPNARIGILHGKLKTPEKEKAMSLFKQGETDILVSTSVVEVGVDIPNARIMMIEGSERFGLSQLHQFRGRVGRGEHESFCFLFTDSQREQAKNRLRKFCAAKDGFEIAELDLQTRGPGQIYGTEQSGRFENLKIASLADVDLITKAKEYAQKLLETDPNLKNYPQLKFEIQKQSKELHFE